LAVTDEQILPQRIAEADRRISNVEPFCVKIALKPRHDQSILRAAPFKAFKATKPQRYPVMVGNSTESLSVRLDHNETAGKQLDTTSCSAPKLRAHPRIANVGSFMRCASGLGLQTPACSRISKGMRLAFQSSTGVSRRLGNP
jgi:hypothetical protein